LLQKVVNGAKIRNWACVNFCEDLSKNVVEQFCFKLAEISRITIYWHEVDKYSGVARAQVQREEMISGLEDMVY